MSTTADPISDLTEERRKQGLKDNGDPPDAGNVRSIRERAATTQVGADDQGSLFDRIVEDEELEKALEARHKANEKKKSATKDYEAKHDEARRQIDVLGLEEDEVVRCGRFKIKRGKRGTPTDVAFTTNPSPRTTISLLSE